VRTEGLLLLLAVGCGGGAAAVPPPEEPAGEEEGAGPIVAVALRMMDEGTDEETQTPRTRVLLVRIVPDEGRSTREVGTFEGICSSLAPDDDRVVGVRCWWAGFGSLIEVRREGDELVATVRRLDEHTGPGSPEEAVRMSLPEHASLRPITAAE